MFRRLTHIPILFSLLITIAHKSVSHHHHREIKSHHHHHESHEHNSFSFVHLDDTFLNASSSKIATDFPVCEINEGHSFFEIRFSPITLAYIIRQDYPPPDPLIHSSYFRGPPLV